MMVKSFKELEEYVALIHTELSDHIGKREKALIEP